MKGKPMNLILTVSNELAEMGKGRGYRLWLI